MNKHLGLALKIIIVAHFYQIAWGAERQEKQPTSPAKSATLENANSKSAYNAGQISILSEPEAEALFQEFASNPDIAFGYPEDGCFARAHLMCDQMAKRGYLCGKVWLLADHLNGPLLSVPSPLAPGEIIRWRFHVAPLVYRRSALDGALSLVVLDPSLFTTVALVSDWVQKQTYHPPERMPLTTFYVTRGSLYDVHTISSSSGRPGAFTKSDLGQAELWNQFYLALQRLREHQALSPELFEAVSKIIPLETQSTFETYFPLQK